jgi:hypothetical protein
MEKLLSYKNDKKIKASLIKRMETHIALDELVQGATGQNGKGCTVWCALNNGDISNGYTHSKFPDVLGLPEWLARLQDRIFEGLSVKEAKKFSIAWVKAIPVGRDLEKVKHRFALWVLRDGVYNTRQHIKDEKRLKAFDKVCDLLDRECLGDAPTKEEWTSAYTSAYASTYASTSTSACGCASASAYASTHASAKKYYLASSKELLKLLRSA